MPTPVRAQPHPAEQAHIDVRLERRRTRPRPHTFKQVRERVDADNLAAREAHHTRYLAQRTPSPTEQLLHAATDTTQVNTCTYTVEVPTKARMLAITRPLRDDWGIPLKEGILSMGEARTPAPRDYLTLREITDILYADEPPADQERGYKKVYYWVVTTRQIPAYRRWGEWRVEIKLLLTWLMAHQQYTQEQITTLGAQITHFLEELGKPREVAE